MFNLRYDLNLRNWQQVQLKSDIRGIVPICMRISALAVRHFTSSQQTNYIGEVQELGLDMNLHSTTDTLSRKERHEVTLRLYLVVFLTDEQCSLHVYSLNR